MSNWKNKEENRRKDIQENITLNTVMHNFIIGPTDTDSVSVCKQDMSPFSNEEIDSLIKEINDLSPEFMQWDNDGYYLSCLALKAKNYVLWDGKKKIIKGSAFKTSSKEISLKEFMQELTDEMLNDNNTQSLVNIYHSYIKEALNVKDIRRWCQKKTVTESVLKCATEACRKNEKDVYDAIKAEVGIQQGDKAYVYPVVLGHDVKPGGVSEKTGKPLKDKVIEITGLKLDKYWTNDHDSEKLVERVWATLQIFKSVLDMEQFTDYNKSKNKHLLEGLK